MNGVMHFHDYDHDLSLADRNLKDFSAYLVKRKHQLEAENEQLHDEVHHHYNKTFRLEEKLDAAKLRNQELEKRLSIATQYAKYIMTMVGQIMTPYAMKVVQMAQSIVQICSEVPN